MPKDVKLVIGAGAGGGLVSWAFTLMTGATFGLNTWEALPLCLVLGMGSALAAVYVITPTDVSQTARLIGYAVLCGFLWKPVLDAGRIVITEKIHADQTSADLKARVSELNSATAQPQVAAPAAADNASELLRTAHKIDNPDLRDKAATQATDAVNAIAATSTADPATATAALSQIRIAAEKTNQPNVARLAATKIMIIQKQRPAAHP
ncbi:MAG TPA: hypothetical protein VG323_10280 [Thermoanaerobaculia bacterium]|nr:hypothetical protein [Thermoanaerobaculia bacterium]